MPQFLPYMKFDNPETGECFTLVDNCRTLHVLDKHPKIDVDDLGCEDCCPSCLDDSPYTGTPEGDATFWAGKTGAGVDDFLGFLALSIEMEPSASVRRRGEPGEDDPEYLPRTLTVRGRIYGDSHAGVYFGETTMLELFTGECGGCDLEATVVPFCPEVSEPETITPQWEPDDLPELVDTDTGCGPCDRQDPDFVPNPLLPAVSGPFDIDTGRRSLMRVRFRSMDIDEDVEIPYCQGREIIIVFEVLDDYEWGDLIEGCLLDLSSEFERCRPPDWSECLMLTDQPGCEDPEVSDPLLEGARPETEPDLGICSPLYRTVKSCLTPELVTSGQIGLGFDLFSGSSDLRNLAVRIYPAYEGQPDPATCEGEKFYSRYKPCIDPLEVAYVGAGSVMSIDPRRSQIVVNCPGAREQRAESSTGGWGFPVLDFQCRYWIVVTADCFNTAKDAYLDAFFFPRWQT